MVGLLVLALVQAPTLAQADTFFQARQWDRAERAYTDIVRADSSNALAWYRLGRIALEARNDARRAITYYQASLRHRYLPLVVPRFGIARAYMALNDHERALAQLDTIAASGFGQPETVRGDSAFRALAGNARYEALLARLQRNAEPCEHAPEARQFDFWIGQWEVFAPNGQRLGSNRIEKTLRGCALIENWTDGMGREGKSFNTFDPQRRLWHQLWVSDNGTVTDYSEGKVAGNTLQFTARSRNANGDSVLQRMTFHHVHRDTVRQVIEASADRGRTWNPPWVGVYVRRKS
jgi:tetratricopeptide (TPR) repeat protein